MIVTLLCRVSMNDESDAGRVRGRLAAAARWTYGALRGFSWGRHLDSRETRDGDGDGDGNGEA